MADRSTILIVEDEASQREILAYNLEAEGFAVARATSGDEAMTVFEEVSPDLVVLDWMLPGVSAIEICRQMKRRSDTREVPVIMLSARTEEADRVRGLETGADDYITKPYSIAELMARVRAQLRRTRPSAMGQALQFQDIHLDAETHRVNRAGKPLKLGPTEFRLLATLMEKPGRVWGRDIFVDSRTVDVHVGRLRKALGVHGGEDPVRTVRGAGYALG